MINWAKNDQHCLNASTRQRQEKKRNYRLIFPYEHSNENRNPPWNTIKQKSEHIKRSVHHGEVGVNPGLQKWFNIKIIDQSNNTTH